MEEGLGLGSHRSYGRDQIDAWSLLAGTPEIGSCLGQFPPISCKEKSYLSIMVWMADVYRLEWGCGCWLTGGLGGNGWTDFQALFSQLVGKDGSVCIGLLPVASVGKGDRITTVRT